MKIKRIVPPKFRVGKLILNELEVRQLQIDVALKEIAPNIEVKDITSNTIHVILENGSFDRVPPNYNHSYKMSLMLLDAQEPLNTNYEE